LRKIVGKDEDDVGLVGRVQLDRRRQQQSEEEEEVFHLVILILT
jgi:hypothetical protein